jgi:hypothetical protein
LASNLSPVPGHAAGVVVELDVLGEEGRVRLELRGIGAAIERVEHLRIQAGDGLRQ